MKANLKSKCMVIITLLSVDGIACWQGMLFTYQRRGIGWKVSTMLSNNGFSLPITISWPCSRVCCIVRALTLLSTVAHWAKRKLCPPMKTYDATGLWPLLRCFPWGFQIFTAGLVITLSKVKRANSWMIFWLLIISWNVSYPSVS